MLYIVLFGLGSVIGMAALSFVIAIPLHQSANGLTRLNTGIQAVFGTFTVVIGMYVMTETLPELVSLMAL